MSLLLEKRWHVVSPQKITLNSKQKCALSSKPGKGSFRHLKSERKFCPVLRSCWVFSEIRSSNASEVGWKCAWMPRYRFQVCESLSTNIQYFLAITQTMCLSQDSTPKYSCSYMLHTRGWCFWADWGIVPCLWVWRTLLLSQGSTWSEGRVKFVTVYHWCQETIKEKLKWVSSVSSIAYTEGTPCLKVLASYTARDTYPYGFESKP